MRHGNRGRRLNHLAEPSQGSVRQSGLVADQARADRHDLAEGQGPRPIVEKLVTLAKRGDLHARRQAIAELRDLGRVKKLFDTIGPRYKARAGGYTRVLKAGFRLGDNAPVAVIEFVDRDRDAKGADDRARHAAEVAAQGGVAAEATA